MSPSGPPMNLNRPPSLPAAPGGCTAQEEEERENKVRTLAL